MKKILLFSLILSTLVQQAQTLSYTDQAVLFSTDDNYGTARFVGMSGSFGALGGDMTAVDINPAGLAVYNQGEFSTSLSYRDTKINTSFYGNPTRTNDDYFRFSQIGGVLAMNSYAHSDWKKFAVGFNYNIIKDFIVMYESSVIDSVKILEESNNHSLKRVKSAIEIHSRFSYLSISSDYSTQHFYYDMLIKYSGLEKLMTAILGKDDSLKWKAIISLASDTFITDAESLLGRLQSINKNNKRVLAKLNDRFGNYLLAEEI